MTIPKKTRKAAHNNQPSKKAPAAKPTRTPRGNSKTKGIEPVARPGTKQANLIALLERPKGATIAQMMAKTSWQPHSIRAALTGLRKRGLAVTRGKNNAGATIYRIPAE